MKLAERFISRAMEPTIKALYEAVRWSPNRSAIQASVNDCAVDHSDSTRRILIGKSRYLYDNSPIIHGLVERLVTYIVGNGLTPSPASADVGFNEATESNWATWCKYCDISSRASFATVQRTIARAIIVDGEIFVSLTRSANNRPRIQLIEAHRIKRIDADRFGRPTAYVMRGKDDETDGPSMAAEFVVHFFRPERAGQTRGIPLLASAINTAQDVHEILAFEKAAVKQAATTVDVVKNGPGSADAEDLLRNGGAAVSDDSSEYYKRTIGPGTRYIKHGDDYQQLTSQRPSASWQGFVDFLSNTVCFPTGLPPSVFLQMKVGGPDTRRDLAAAQRVVSCWQQDIEGGLQLIFEYVTEADSRTQLPADWRTVTWQYPRAITVDAGRQSQADREDVRTGAMTLAELCGQYGESEKTHVAQLISEEVALDPGVSEDEARRRIRFRLYGALPPAPNQQLAAA